MAIAAASAFELANATEGARLYDLHMLSEQGGLVPSSLGMAMQTVDRPAFRRHSDAIIDGNDRGVYGQQQAVHG
ncbi:hypothetical protein [Stenotrophomonas maltophilia]|uniref:hypothetical protein n=1 Tax=Stenotrophomonas maltophilia TaxID=40324 RepID=UPI001ED9A131|nr:hypothetical protein [Stenotrophomonas maltophilia]